MADFDNDEEELVESPLVQALRAHFDKYYASESRYAQPFSSRNQVAPPLNLELMNASQISEMCKTRGE